MKAVAAAIRARGEDQSTGIPNPIGYQIKKAVEREREACAKIADQVREERLETYTGLNYPLHTIAQEIRDKIRARGEES